MHIAASKHWQVWALPLAVTLWLGEGIVMIHFLCFTVRIFSKRWRKNEQQTKLH